MDAIEKLYRGYTILIYADGTASIKDMGHPAGFNTGWSAMVYIDELLQP